MTAKRLLLAAASALLCVAGASAAETVTPPDKIAFNYPAPPKEGKSGFFVIAEAGQARCCLVVPAQPRSDEQYAAEMLRNYLKLTTGAEFLVVEDNKTMPPGLAQIHVGETTKGKETALDLPTLNYGDQALPNINGFLIKTVDPQTLLLRGVRPRATVFAVVGLLERYAGVRRYWDGEPGGIGDVVPSQATFKLPEVEWRDWPYFLSLSMSGVDSVAPTRPLSRFSRLSDFYRTRSTIPSNESFYRLMKATQHFDEPALFPLINGQRFVPRHGESIDHDWQPCVSNPRVADLMVETILETFKKNPQAIAETISVNDGYGDCECAQCRAMDAPGADVINRIGLCDRYVKFINIVAGRVAKEYPDRILSFLSYGSMEKPPTTVQLSPTLMPVLCPGDNTFELWDEWQKMGAKNMGLYLLHNDMRLLIPKLDVHQSAKRLRYIVGTNLARHFYQEFYGVPPLTGMVGYVQAEMTWDPRLSEDALLAEFYEKFFRTAAGPMKEFYGALETGYEQWLVKNGKPHPYGLDASSMLGSDSYSQFEVLPVELAAAAEKHLEAALVAAAGDDLARKRVELVKAVFGFGALGAREYWAAQRLKSATVGSPEAAEKAVADARELVDSGLAFAAYKYAVENQPPVSLYHKHSDSSGTDSGGMDKVYRELEPNTVNPAFLGDIARSFSLAGASLRKALGAEQAQAWWREREQAETRPILKNLMGIGLFAASGSVANNLVRDASFEERGRKRSVAAGQPPSESAAPDGLHVWHRAGTPMSCMLADETAHTGKFSAVFWETQHAAVSESIAAKPGESYKLSLWVRHNDQKGAYTLTAIPRGKAMLADSSADVPWKPNEWQQVEIYFTTPPDTASLGLYLYVDKQTPGAKVWVDDFFIGKVSR